jgi:hypothetical protein
MQTLVHPERRQIADSAGETMSGAGSALDGHTYEYDATLIVFL